MSREIFEWLPHYCCHEGKKVVFATAGPKVMGGAMVTAFGREGASGVIPDTDGAGSKSNAAYVEALGQRSITLHGDVSHPSQVKEKEIE